jgi:peptidoglycan/LPS O-acetylase OafA/YrhL
MRNSVAPAGARRVGGGTHRLHYLDGVRALAALYVLAHHLWLITWQHFPQNVGPAWVGWLIYGHLAVAVFIVVSGFSLAIEPVRNEGRLRGGVRRFIRRRAWRILPTYWAALALSCLALAITHEEILGYDGTVLGHQPVTVEGVVVHGVLLQDVIGSPTPNGTFWSIAIEWQIYFLFPLLLWWRRRYGAVSTVVLTTVIVVASYEAAISVRALAPILNLVPQFLALFVFGMIAAEVIQRSARRSLLLAGAGLGAVTVIGYLQWAGSAEAITHLFWLDLAVGGCTALLLAALALPERSRMRDVLGGRVLRGTGRFSYSIYLMHAPLLAVVWRFVVVPMDLRPTAAFVVFACVGAPIAVGGSWLFSRVFEEPFVRHRGFAALSAAVRDRLPARVTVAPRPANEESAG